MKYLYFFSLLSVLSCQKYTCQCEGVYDAQFSAIIAPEQEHMTKTSYGLAEKDCIKKGEKTGQKCYILID